VPHFPLHDFQGHVTQGVLYRANSNWDAEAHWLYLINLSAERTFIGHIS
jgi:hypothetical protein